MVRQLQRFLLTGGVATGFQYLILGLCTEFLEWSAPFASGVGYLFGSVVSYLLNYFFTFESNRTHLYAIPSFYLMVMIGWCINTFAMTIFVNSSKWHYIPIVLKELEIINFAPLTNIQELNKWGSQILATLLTIVWNFSASRTWVFRAV